MSSTHVLLHEIVTGNPDKKICKDLVHHRTVGGGGGALGDRDRYGLMSCTNQGMRPPGRY